MTSILDEFSPEQLAYALRRRGYVVLRQQDVRVVSGSTFTTGPFATGPFADYVKDELGVRLGRLLVADDLAKIEEHRPATEPWMRRFDVSVDVVIGWPKAIEETLKVVAGSGKIGKTEGAR